MTIARILIVAGSDSGGGAGIQADIKTVTMLGGHAMTAVTAITAQNTLGVQAIHMVPPGMIAQQMASVIDDIGCDAVKIGMLGDAATIVMVAAGLPRARAMATQSGSDCLSVPLVLDPVMVAKGGTPLLRDDAVAALRQRLLPLSTVVTPNAPELALLTGEPVETEEQARAAALMLARDHRCAVLAKGGHLPGEMVVDQLATADGRVRRWSEARIAGRNTHGTGCTLASAIATGLAQGLRLPDAIERARGYVRAAIAAAPDLGAGHGPMGHALGLAPYDVVG